MGSKPAIRRSACPINFAVEIFGDRWTLLILRDLLLMNRRRYGELLAAEEGIATNILADRLKRLERQGVILRSRDPDDARQFVYRPTEKGVALIPVLLEISAWGARFDAQTGAPVDFLDRFDADRASLIARFSARVRQD